MKDVWKVTRRLFWYDCGLHDMDEIKEVNNQ